MTLIHFPNHILPLIPIDFKGIYDISGKNRIIKKCVKKVDFCSHSIHMFVMKT